jgi:hypothetical protein
MEVQFLTMRPASTDPAMFPEIWNGMRTNLRLLPLILLVACGKEEQPPGPEPLPPPPAPAQQDYRDAIVGDYVGYRHFASWSMSSPNGYDTTYARSFSIEKDTADSSIIADGQLFRVDANLHFYESPYPGVVRSFAFSNDTATIFLRSGGLGGYSATTTVGVRQ